jgi:hypothetical protein
MVSAAHHGADQGVTMSDSSAITTATASPNISIARMQLSLTPCAKLRNRAQCRGNRKARPTRPGSMPGPCGVCAIIPDKSVRRRASVWLNRTIGDELFSLRPPVGEVRPSSASDVRVAARNGYFQWLVGDRFHWAAGAS